jgi:hypothetical protein
MKVGNSTRQVKYQGYIVDLVEKLSKMLGFQYTIRPVSDGLYGHRRPDGSWTGMIGEVVNKVWCPEKNVSSIHLIISA